MTDGDGLFVTVEGIDGSGTTSVVERLAVLLADRTDEDVVKTEEPTGTLWTGRVVREAFEERDVSELSRLHLFMADRADHSEKIVDPAVEEGKLVVSDRGPDSTRAYQSNTTGETVGAIDEMLRRFTVPDLTIMLDVPVDVAEDRLSGDRDAFENRKLQEDVVKTYRWPAANTERIHAVDATRPLDVVVSEAAEIITENL